MEAKSTNLAVRRDGEATASTHVREYPKGSYFCPRSEILDARSFCLGLMNPPKGVFQVIPGAPAAKAHRRTSPLRGDSRGPLFGLRERL
jgi:hypothetical protein